MQRIIKLIVVAILPLMAISCKKTSVLTYKMRNQAFDSILVVTFKPVGDTAITDTFRIAYNQEAVIDIRQPGKEHVSHYKEVGATLNDFSRIDVYRMSGQPSITLFSSPTAWKYEEHGKHLADYVCTVTENDF